MRCLKCVITEGASDGKMSHFHGNPLFSSFRELNRKISSLSMLTYSQILNWVDQVITKRRT